MNMDNNDNEHALNKQRMALCELLMLRLKKSEDYHETFYITLNGAFSKFSFSNKSDFRKEVEDLLHHYIALEDYKKCAVIRNYLAENFHELSNKNLKP